MKIRRRQPGDAAALKPALGPVLARIYAARGVDDLSELEYDLNHLPGFGKLSNIDDAAGLIADAVEGGQRIVVVGDYDADGATATTLAVEALRQMGATEVSYSVPNRFVDGYGLKPALVETFADRSPDLVITVDNGIASLEGVAAAQGLGAKVVVTDHHLPGPELPPAEAIVNPNLPGDDFESRNLAGVGVAFYVMSAVRAELRQRGWFDQQDQPSMGELLDLVAIGTVADVVPLDRVNRILVQHGLALMRAGRARPGVRALLETAGRRAKSISSTDLGFVVGPRLNAAGRMDDMSLGIETLLESSLPRALDRAMRLEHLNRERRTVEVGMEEEALAVLESISLGDPEQLPPGLAVYDPGWHEGVLGIVASRLRERFHRPVLAFADGEEGIKGSMRSIRKVHARDLLETIDLAHPGLILNYGGHAMAAGATLAADRFDDFRASFEAEVEKLVEDDDLQGTWVTDGALAADDMTLDLARSIRGGGPWGRDFEDPTFDGVFEVTGRAPVGDKHLRMQLKPEDGDRPISAIAFRTSDEDWPQSPFQATIVYRLTVNDFREPETVQIQALAIEPEQPPASTDKGDD